jgi:hypothetical protein
MLVEQKFQNVFVYLGGHRDLLLLCRHWRDGAAGWRWMGAIVGPRIYQLTAFPK